MLQKLLSSALLTILTGCLTGGCATMEKTGGSLAGDFLWKSSNQSEAYWGEQRAAQALLVTFIRDGLADVVLAVAGEDAHQVFSGKISPTLAAIKTTMDENKAKTDAQAGLMGDVAKGGLVATLMAGSGFGAHRFGRKKNGNGATT